MVDVEKIWMYHRKSVHNDILESEDLKEVLYLCGKDPSDKQVNTIMDDEGGVISFHRFPEIVSSIHTITKDDVMRAFRIFDTNGDNFLSLQELRVLLMRLGDKMSNKEVDKIFGGLDTNKDGKLDYREFCALYSSTNKKLDHMMSVRVPEENKSREKETPFSKSLLSSATVSDSETESESETETDDEGDIFVPVPSNTPVKQDKKEAAVKPKSKANLLKSDKRPTEYTKSAESEKSESSTSKKSATPKSANKSTSKLAPIQSSASPEQEEPKAEETKVLNRNVRGCTYAGDRGDWTAHQYTMSVPVKTKVTMLLSPLAESPEDNPQSDLTLYIVKSDDNELRFLSDVLSYGRCKLTADLDPGDYTILTHTTSCNFVNESTLPVTPVPVKVGGKLSSVAVKVFTDVFHCLDLDGNMRLSREEFELFHITSSGETLSDSMWDVIRDNFQLNQDEITLSGFLKLHEMALEDEDGGEEEIRDTLGCMGYNAALQLVKALPWHIDVHSDSEVELKVKSLVALTDNPTLERAVVWSVETYGTVENDRKYKLYTQKLPWKCSSVVYNKGDKPLRVEINTEGSENCLDNPPYNKHILTVPANKAVVCHHFSPISKTKEFSPKIKIKCLPAKTTRHKTVDK